VPDNGHPEAQPATGPRRLLDAAERNSRFLRPGKGVDKLDYRLALPSKARENCEEVGTRLEARTEEP
ncbi:MAG: hypothetical protein ACF8NJ_11410, partial [Phycisphaerales bacterium JB038]